MKYLTESLYYMLSAEKGKCEVPDGIREIASRAFEGNNDLKEIVLSDSVTILQPEAIEYCKNLTSVNLPRGIEFITAYVFSNCPKLASVVIPDSVSTISIGAFENCKGLKEVVIPASVSLISENTFAEARNQIRCQIKTDSGRYPGDCTDPEEPEKGHCKKTHLRAGAFSFTDQALAFCSLLFSYMSLSARRTTSSTHSSCFGS